MDRGQRWKRPAHREQAATRGALWADHRNLGARFQGQGGAVVAQENQALHERGDPEGAGEDHGIDHNKN
jgi:hypothetical protein